MNTGETARFAAALTDRYLIERELGAGGMATVYLAHDLKHDRKVAIKVLHQDLAAALGAERFLAEIKTTAKLQHPHILPLLDSGEAAGLLYYVMPYVAGESLRDRLNREKQLPIDDAVRIAREVADALGHAHGHGIIHRDIKPENVLVQEGHALVADFGIALAVSAAGGQRLTQTGLSLGTPQYMSPEQAMGDRQLDARADIYALGALTYEMLTGEPPFTGATVQAIVARVMAEEPRAITNVRRSVPVHVERAVLCALEKLPADRWQRCSDFALRLAGASAASDGSVFDGARTRRTTLMGRGAIRRAALGSVVMVVLIAGAIWARRLWVAHRAGVTEDRTSIAVLPFENVSGDAGNEPFAVGISDDIRIALHALGLPVAARSSSLAWKGRQAVPNEVGASLRVSVLLTGTYSRAGHELKVTAELVRVADGAVMWSERYLKQVTEVLSVQDSIATAVAAALKLTLATGGNRGLRARSTGSVEARDLYQRARFHHDKYTRADLERAIDLYDQASVIDPRYVDPVAGKALAWVNLADDWYPPRDAYPRAKAAALRALAMDETSAQAHSVLGLVRLYFDWDLAEAQREFTRARALDAEAFPSPDDGMAILMDIRGQADSAIAIHRAVVEREPVASFYRGQLAWSLIAANRLDSAESVLRDLARIEPRHPWMRLYMAQVRMRQARYAEGMREIALGDTTMVAAVSLMAQLEAAAGHPAVAAQRIAELEGRRRREYVDGVFIAGAYAALRDHDAAFRWLDTAFTDRSAQLASLGSNSAFDPIRSDPRFRALQQRVMAAAGRPPS